jgi:predicted AAA+ superfamily ATPase
MIINRDTYLNQLIERKENGQIKVITGIRRCGKSYLLFELYYSYLLSLGINPNHIIRIALDSEENEELLDRKKLNEKIKFLIVDESKYYIMLDEIQLVDGFEKVLNSLNRNNNLDIYVTGSNSKFLSSDILTEFRGRGDEIRVYPLSFKEYSSVYDGSIDQAWIEYFTYGGLPLILNLKSDQAKSKYLKGLFENTYIKDVVDRNHIQKDTVLDAVIDMLASSTGSLTNPLKIANTFKSKGHVNATDKTIKTYIDCLIDAFLIEKVSRYDVKGKRYIDSPFKYYFTDIGLRNARLNFRQQEENHIMENLIFNELLIRGYNVDVGVVEVIEKNEDNMSVRKKFEIDFICNMQSKKYYIQSAYEIPTKEKLEQEQQSLLHTKDSFKKIIIVKDRIKPWHNEDGILIIGLMDFFLNIDSLEL